jgi:hypothetical protein
MRLLRAWPAAAAVVVTGLLLDSVALMIAGRHVGSSPGVIHTVLLVHVPWTLILLTATVVAALVHREQVPVARHLAAVFGVPALTITASLALGMAQGAVVGGVLSAAEAAVGAVLGWLVRRRFAQRDQGSYFPAY